MSRKFRPFRRLRRRCGEPIGVGDAPARRRATACTELEVRGQSPDSLEDSNRAQPKFVQIRGEVVVNESGGGPRLAVDVEAMSATFEPTRVVGSVSLMLLNPKRMVRR